MVTQDIIVAYILIGVSIRRAEKHVDSEPATALDKLNAEIQANRFRLDFTFSLPPLLPPLWSEVA